MQTLSHTCKLSVIMHACHVKSITGCKLINQHVYQSHYTCILYIYPYNPNNNPTLICLLS